METPAISPPATLTVSTGPVTAKIPGSEFERRCPEQIYGLLAVGAQNGVTRQTNVAWKSGLGDGCRAQWRRPGGEFAASKFVRPDHWLDTRAAIQNAQRLHERSDGPARILLVYGSAQKDGSGSPETSRTLRIAEVVRERLQSSGCEVDLLDTGCLDVDSDNKPVLRPGEGCAWMDTLYPRWVAAHGIMIVSPVPWIQACRILKPVMQRLADPGGPNPGPLAGRVFSVIVHGEVERAMELRRTLHGWLSAMDLVPAGAEAMAGGNSGGFEDNATSHEALNHDTAFMQEASNAAAVLMMSVAELRMGQQASGQGAQFLRQK